MARKDNDVTRPRPGDLPEDTRIGRYRIARVVGRGGMGTVYSAFDEDTKRDVAIKVLKSGLPDLLQERFLAECEAEAKIRHPHVMPVYDRGTFKGDRPYFVMELVYEPITLSDVVEANLTGLTAQRWPRLRQWSNPARLVQDVIIPICEGVDASNREYGIFHRDIKPDNVLIDVRTRRASLIDFGICYQRGQALEGKKIIGTPRFLSPEQAMGRIDERTDVFGCGVLVYYVFTGRPPIQASSLLRKEERAKRVAELAEEEGAAKKAGNEERVAELAARRAALEDPEFRTVEDMVLDARAGRYAQLPDHVPAAARAIIAKAMAKDPEDRYANAAELAIDLRAWIDGGPVRALAEQTTTGAAVAAAGRTMRRHVTTALWVLLGLIVGLPIGVRLLSGEDEATLVRIEDVQAETDALVAQADALQDLEATSLEGALRWRTLKAGVKAARRRAAGLEESDKRAEVERRLGALSARLPSPILRLAADDRRGWVARSVIDHRDIEVQPGDSALAPGPYWLKTKRLSIPFRLPLTAEPGPAPVIEIGVELPQGGVPPDMVYVPAGPPAPGEPGIGAFFLSVSEVTYVEYAEWLDELESEDRDRYMPPEGFVADPNLPGRYLAAPEFEDLPVLGLRPADATAYAAWRTEVYGVEVRLPTQAEWRRAAGGTWLSPAGAAYFRPMTVAAGKPRPDLSPYGVVGMLTHPVELVTTEGGFAIQGEGAGVGVPPSAAALARSRPVPAGERLEAGIRLVQPLR